MRIIKNTIKNIIKWAASDNNLGSIPENDYSAKVAIGSNRYGPDMPGMNFTIFNAIGGKVVQINQYNPSLDRSKQQLYIITDKDDLGAELGQIITVESLSR